MRRRPKQGVFSTDDKDEFQAGKAVKMKGFSSCPIMRAGFEECFHNDDEWPPGRTESC